MPHKLIGPLAETQRDRGRSFWHLARFELRVERDFAVFFPLSNA